jgi:hypothetical protein
MANTDREQQSERVEDLGGDGVGGTISAGDVAGETIEGKEAGNQARAAAGPLPGNAGGVRPSEIADGMPGGTAVGGGPGITTDGRS